MWVRISLGEEMVTVPLCVSGELPVQAPQGVVLRGRLRRLDRGRPAGELDARFTYTPGD
jgi:hypothetical protein